MAQEGPSPQWFLDHKETIQARRYSVKTLRTEYMNLGGSIDVSKTPKKEMINIVLRLCTSLTTTGTHGEGDAERGVERERHAQVRRNIDARVQDRVWVNNVVRDLPFNPIMLALVSTPDQGGYILTGENEVATAEQGEQRGELWTESLLNAMTIMEDTFPDFPDLEGITLDDPDDGISGYEEALGVMDVDCVQKFSVLRRNPKSVKVALSVAIRRYDKEESKETSMRHSDSSAAVDMVEVLEQAASATVSTMNTFVTAMKTPKSSALSSAEQAAMEFIPEGKSVAEAFRDDTAEGLAMRSALFKVSDPVQSSAVDHVKSGTLQNLICDINTYLNTHFDYLTVPQRQVRNLIFGVHSETDGADLATWQKPPPAAELNMRSPVDLEETISFGGTPVAVSRKKEVRFPRIQDTSTMFQCMSVQSNALSQVASVLNRGDFDEMMKFLNALSQYVSFRGVWDLYYHWADAKTKQHRSFVMGRDTTAAEPKWMTVLLMEHVQRKLTYVRQHHLIEKEQAETALLLRIYTLESSGKRTGGSPGQRLGEPSTGKSTRASRRKAAREQIKTEGQAKEAERIRKGDKKKRKAPPSPIELSDDEGDSKTMPEFAAFKTRSKELFPEPPFPCFDHHCKKQGCGRQAAGVACGYSHEGEKYTLPEGY